MSKHVSNLVTKGMQNALDDRFDDRLCELRWMGSFPTSTRNHGLITG